MENNSPSLESNLKGPSWTQWLPTYGIYGIFRDMKEGKPAIIFDKGGYGNKPSEPLIFYGSMIYQATSTAALALGALKAISDITEKLG